MSVRQGEELCRIAVGPVNLRVDAPCDGTVNKIYVQNGTYVDTGDPLFELSGIDPLA
jgi:biotin carboxyl carrier protein